MKTHLKALTALILLMSPVSTWALINNSVSRSGLLKGEFKTGLGGSYYYTMRNFNSDGERVALGKDASFQAAKGTGFLMLGLSDDIMAFTDVQYVYNRAETTLVENFYSGLGDADVGLHYEPKGSPLPFMIDFEFLFPLYQRATPSEWASTSGKTAVPAGNGAMELGLTGTGELPLAKHVNLGAGVGYVYVSSGFSSYIPFRSYLKFELPRYFFFRGGVIGQVSTETDAFSTNTVAQDRSNNILAGSKAYNSVNPAFLGVELLSGIYVTPQVFFNLGAQTELMGQNISQGLLIFGTAGFHFGEPTPSSLDSRDSGYGHQQSNRGFHEYEGNAKIVQANNKLKMFLINKGMNDNIQTGQYFDIFDGNGPVARAQVTEVGPTRSKLEIKEYFDGEMNIEEGFVVRRPVR